MQIQSELPCDVYLKSMKEQFGSWSDFWSERFTGFIIGRFFYVCHYAGKEFNRRVTDERHCAIGYVKPVGGKTSVSCLRFAGFSDPVSLVGIFLLCLGIFALCAYDILSEIAWLALIPTGFAVLYSAIAHSVTQRGVEGSKTLTALLTDPDNFYMCL